jgi:hypothetical protein
MYMIVGCIKSQWLCNTLTTSLCWVMECMNTGISLSKIAISGMFNATPFHPRIEIRRLRGRLMYLAVLEQSLLYFYERMLNNPLSPLSFFHEEFRRIDHRMLLNYPAILKLPFRFSIYPLSLYEKCHAYMCDRL